MAHTKAGGSTKLGRDSAAKRLGVKLFGGQEVKGGGIIVRQLGAKMIAGEGAALSADHTIYATRAGKVSFATRQVTRFTGRKSTKTVVSVTE